MLRFSSTMRRSPSFAGPEQRPPSSARKDLAAAGGGADRFWTRWGQVRSSPFLYLEESAGVAHLPGTREEIDLLLRAHSARKKGALYESFTSSITGRDWV